MMVTSKREFPYTAQLQHITPQELIAAVERIWSPEPDMNFNYLQQWLQKGCQITRVSLWSHFGPAGGGPAIFFFLRHPSGDEFYIPVAPGKSVIEFISQNAEEWQRGGVIFERVQWSVKQK
ncbi:MAG: hypothetical protein NZ805_14360 [Armatimonadetes bacterium]|nr:hypothetical protein [Armatimonadota bacterium]MDW8027698.1 hypothetical protein [Armatimonadota bacterium]